MSTTSTIRIAEVWTRANGIELWKKTHLMVNYVISFALSEKKKTLDTLAVESVMAYFQRLLWRRKPKLQLNRVWPNAKWHRITEANPLRLIDLQREPFLYRERSTSIEGESHTGLTSDPDSLPFYSLKLKSYAEWWWCGLVATSFSQCMRTQLFHLYSIICEPCKIEHDALSS